MATPAQIAAAVANARKSTGPRTPEGKAVSSKNATKLGLYAQTLILPGEDPEALLALSRDYQDEFHPETPTEQVLLDRVVLAHWLMRRYFRLETEFFNTRIAALPKHPDPIETMTIVFIQDCEGPRVLHKISRRQQFAERRFCRAVTDFRAAIAARRARLAAGGPGSAIRAAARLSLQKRTGFALPPFLKFFVSPTRLTRPGPLSQTAAEAAPCPGAGSAVPSNSVHRAA